MTKFRHTKLGDCIDVKHGFAFKSEYYAGSGPYVLLTPGNFDEQGGFVWRGENQKHYNGPVPAEFILKPGDVLVAMTEQAEGLLGSTAIVPSGRKFLHNQRLGLISLRQSAAVDARFIYYLFNTQQVRAQIRASASGTKVRHTSPSRIRAVEVNFPDLPTQRRIASILGAYDALIENNLRRIAILEDMARQLFEEWFVRFRFPGHEHCKVAETLDGPTPEGWTWSRLGKAARVNANVIRPHTAPHRIGYIDISSVTVGEVTSVEWLDFQDAPGRARRRVRDGSVIWSMVRPNRRSFAVILDPPADLIVSTGFAVLDAVTVPFPYLYEWVTTDEFIGYLINNATGAAYPAVTGAAFERAGILIPRRQLVEQFATASEPMMRLAANLRRANTKLSPARDLLLPRLVSGDLSVAAAERALETAS